MTEPRPRPFRKWTGRLCLLALVVVIAVTAWFRLSADENPYATLILFGPRWVALVPLVGLALLSLLALSLRGLLCCLIMAGVILVPFMGAVLPGLPQPAEPGTIRVMTFNADAKQTHPEEFRAYLERAKPAIVALQDADRITAEDFPPGWFVVPAANGLKLASTYPAKLLGELSDPVIGPARGAAKFSVSTPSGEQVIGVVHLPTPRPGLEAVLARKPGCLETLQKVITQRDAASRKVQEWLQPSEKTILCGDFNLPVESAIYQRDWGRYRNAFSHAGEGIGHTMLSTRGAVRIDHILVAASRPVYGVTIGPDLGSAHRPLLAEVMP
jgi:vancomycin resistance protein VanJ